MVGWGSHSYRETRGGRETCEYFTIFFDSALQVAAQIEAFFLAMILNPDVQAKAQKELDDVLGGGRLPDISDRPQLPYVEAVCKELFRWHTISPTGIYSFVCSWI
jgi:cytochrome P450